MIDVPILVKDALRAGSYKKNYRFVVLNEDGTADTEIGTIDNNYLVAESVNLDERMCSGDTLKFGLCEGSSLEFQYFNKPNITGRQIQAFIDVDYGTNEPYTIPMGYFTVKKCSRQASTGLIKVTAYNKLQSDYLDAKANTLLSKQFTYNTNVTLFDIESILLSDYQIDEVRRGHPEGGELIEPWPIEINHVFNFESSYGVNTFFNSYVLSDYDNTGFKLCIDSYSVPYNNSDCRAEAFSGSLMQLERIVADWICNVIGNAHIGVTPSEVYEAIRSEVWGVNFADFFSVYINGKTCSTIQYEYDMETQGTSNYGTMQDAWVFKENYSATVNLVGHIGVIAPNGEAGDEVIWLNMDATPHAPGKTSGNSYYYYADAQHNLALGSVEPFRSSDGVAFDHSAAMSTDYITVYQYEDLPPALKVSVNINNLPDFTLRDIVSATYETVCQFGKLDRVTDLFSGVELNRSRLLPAETLYPANSLYPGGADASGFKSMYSKLWADEGNVHKWRNLIITYNGLGDEEKTLQRTINADGTDDYNMSNNWIFRNQIWQQNEVAAYANAMVEKMRNMAWFPFEMWCAGLPYVETGDEIEIPLGNRTYTSYILQRQLKGIQNLQDTYINGTLDIF